MGIEENISNIITAQLLFLESVDSKKDVLLYINSPGGSVYAGLGIYDTMQYIKPDVATICMGQAASMGAFLLAGGAKGKRSALPNSSIMIHQPMGQAQGQAEDIKVEAAQIVRIKENLVKLYSMMTGQTTDQIIKDLDRDNFMSAQEACSYGIVDKVIDVDYTK